MRTAGQNKCVTNFFYVIEFVCYNRLTRLLMIVIPSRGQGENVKLSIPTYLHSTDLDQSMFVLDRYKYLRTASALYFQMPCVFLFSPTSLPFLPGSSRISFQSHCFFDICMYISLAIFYRLA